MIDGINRGNTPKAFGVKVTLPYSGEEFGLPSRSPAKAGVPANLLIIGTTPPGALRRRFTFVELMPQPELLGEVAGVSLGKLLTALNRKLEAYLDRDHQIGHSYLMNLTTVADLRFAWDHKVMPLLQEYFYGDGEKLLAILGTKLIQTETIKIGGGDSADERTVHRFRAVVGDAEFVGALKELANS